MAYFAPYIDSSGMHVPSYTDIRDDLLAAMKTIFGDDIYLDEDSQDYQQISIFARKIYDTNALALLTYNNRTANTAIGAGLDIICAMVGITRKPATYSKVRLTITGAAGTVITNGQATDVERSYFWDLPETVTIPDSGTITVEALCHTSGNVSALANTITYIATPLYGWYGVTNNYSADAGTNAETDAELRDRFYRSTMLPANTAFESITASIRSVSGVTRVKGFENDTGTTSTEGFPPHSITYVVEGGTDLAVATEIYYKKTPGCYTNGTTEVQLTSLSGNVSTIRFYRPTVKPIYVKIELKKLAGYTTAYVDKIKAALVEYIKELQISEDVYRSILWSVAAGQATTLTSPEYTVTEVYLSTDGENYTSSDIDIAFNEVASLSVDNVTIEVS